MKVLRTVSLALLVLACWALPVPAAEQRVAQPVYLNHEWGFTVPIPPGWHFQAARLWVLDAPGSLKSETSESHLFVLVRHMGARSLRAVAEAQRRELAALDPGPCEKISVGGRTGYRLLWQSQSRDPWGQPTASYHLRAYLPLSEGRMLVLAGASVAPTRAESRAELPTLLWIVRGVRFSPGR